MTAGNRHKGRGPLVALVGRPNVGKSTLFNRLCGGHHAIVENEAGTTRDRRYGKAEWTGKLFRVVDTGGLDFDAAKPDSATLERGILKQSLAGAKEAELVVMVCDAKTGLLPSDREVLTELRKLGKPVIIAANKIDRQADETMVAELWQLGVDEVIGISAQHGRAVGDLCDAIVARLPHAPSLRDLPEDDEEQKAPIRIALVGRPNAGKSSLLNRFLGEERVLVDARAGTTRDPIDAVIDYDGREYLVIDTAGIRKRAKLDSANEKISVAMAEKAILRAEIAVLVVDGAQGLAEQEAKIAGICHDAGRGLVICFNKCDLYDSKQENKLREELNRKLQFIPWARVVHVSAQTGKGIKRLMDAVHHSHKAYTTRVPTGALNRWFEGIVDRHPPSLFKGLPVKLYYITQAETSPPTFVLSVNYPEGVHFSYQRYLANQLRAEFHLDGTPLRIICRARGRGARAARG